MKAWWLKHAFTPKPRPCDTSTFLMRLLKSLRVRIDKDKRGGWIFWLTGGADF